MLPFCWCFHFSKCKYPWNRKGNLQNNSRGKALVKVVLDLGTIFFMFWSITPYLGFKLLRISRWHWISYLYMCCCHGNHATPFYCAISGGCGKNYYIKSKVDKDLKTHFLDSQWMDLCSEPKKILSKGIWQYFSIFNGIL